MRMKRLSIVTAALVALPLGLGSLVAAQSEEPTDPMGAAFWTGTWTGTESAPGTESPGAGFTEILGEVSHGLVQADDPRVVGDWVQVANHHVATSRDSGEGKIGLVSGTARIDNDAGAWVGTWTAYGGQPGGEEWYVMEGEGAYEGLTTVFRFHFLDNSFEGVILPTDMPPVPDQADPAG